MSISNVTQAATVALLGNPNTGKSTLFNALSGIRQRVGNYPGVTVEKKTGSCTADGVKLSLIDLPGSYSLAPRSPDEMVAVDVLLGRRADTPQPDMVLCIIDASNLERNLYLVSQVLEVGLPMVIALNMIDVAEERGITIDIPALEKKIGVPVIPIQANRKQGLDGLRTALANAVGKTPAKYVSPFPEAFQQEVTALEKHLNQQATKPLPRYLAERLLLDVGGYVETFVSERFGRSALEEVTAARARLAEQGIPTPAVEAMSRYDWASKTLAGAVVRPKGRKVTFSDRIDAVLTHKVLGTIIFVSLMAVVFLSIFWFATPLMDSIDWLFGLLGEAVGANLAEGPLRSLLVDGVIGGVGGVIIFLPQILILFLFIAILEDCGYMARAAYLMDKLMSRVGLSGKSFIPLLSSFACAIPGVMAARVIENRRDRLVTILVAPLMSCSARLPVYALLIAAFIPDWRVQGLTMLAMYLVGIVAAVLVAWTLKSTILRGETPPFVMELPGYKIPSIATVLSRVADRGLAFLYRAGTLILAVSILVWLVSYFPRSAETEQSVRDAHAAQLAQLQAETEALRPAAEAAAKAEESKAEESKATPAKAADGEEAAATDPAILALQEKETQLAELESHIDGEVNGALLRESYLGQAGKWVEPIVRPLGWDWRIGCAAIASFPAREVIVGTLGVIYNLGDDNDEESAPLQQALKDAKWPDGRPVYTLPVALSIMVFFALCAQCGATLAVIKRETNSWGWPIFTFVYMTGLAYIAALATYQIGTLIMRA
ncbi:ferrous iron transport protein B [Lignipirellula cremea]|uniref:Ferrous iron transport protein B n=1 Tax=Lignipirellula cremea TaxID=2528010 RepID=A0A518E0H9_9BACT|nr:ferrous iron transport protein B [Lignipirellula cremea]QDU97561.1 Ferrous iron transport protein B [Lignipirellula cremea]